MDVILLMDNKDRTMWFLFDSNERADTFIKERGYNRCWLREVRKLISFEDLTSLLTDLEILNNKI